MAQRDYTIELKEPRIPMLSEQQERTIIGGSEKARAGNTGRPALYYAHNVMPTLKGLDSVGFEEVVPAVIPATTTLSDARIVYSSSRVRLYMAWDSEGRAYDLEEGETTWTQLADTTPSTFDTSFDINNVTLGRVNGITYIWYKGVGCFIYDSTLHQLTSVTLGGISIADTLGITASSGYLVAYTSSATAWSSTIDPTDFVPSTLTGAGGGNVAGIGGDIKYAVPNTLGILYYSDTNVIAATYSGNVQYPFKYRPVDNSAGGISLDLIAYEANSAAQFAFTKAGLQSITSQKAINILPEVTDFLAGERFEDFDEATKLLTVTELSSAMKKKIKFVAQRYLVVSYGIDAFTHAIVYDTALERLGKLKVTHVDCLEYIGAQVEIAKQSLAFLAKDGTMRWVNFARNDVSTGVAIFGKFQYTRNRTITLQGVEIETIKTGASLEVTDLVSYDGKTTPDQVVGTLKESAAGVRKYHFLSSASNHSLLLIGQFQLTTLFILYTLHGRR